MSEEIKVSPTPIQRNAHDVAMELLNIYLKNQYATEESMDINYLRKLYIKFYATAKGAERLSSDLIREYGEDSLKEDSK